MLSEIIKLKMKIQIQVRKMGSIIPNTSEVGFDQTDVGGLNIMTAHTRVTAGKK